MRIESKHVVVDTTIEEVFNYLTDLRNLNEILPQDKITDWKGEENYCVFKIKGASSIDLALEEKNPHDYIKYISGSESPFPFVLEVFLQEQQGSTMGYLLFNAKVNAFIKMVAEKPLATLFDHMADKLITVKSSRKRI